MNFYKSILTCEFSKISCRLTVEKTFAIIVQMGSRETFTLNKLLRSRPRLMWMRCWWEKVADAIVILWKCSIIDRQSKTSAYNVLFPQRVWSILWADTICTLFIMKYIHTIFIKPSVIIQLTPNNVWRNKSVD